MLERLAKKNAESVRIIKVDAVNNQSWASKERVRVVPAFRFYRGGQLVDRFKGAYPEKTMQEKIDKLAPVFAPSSSSEKGGDSEVAKKSKEPIIQPMSKKWLPPGVTRE